MSTSTKRFDKTNKRKETNACRRKSFISLHVKKKTGNWYDGYMVGHVRTMKRTPLAGKPTFLLCKNIIVCCFFFHLCSTCENVRLHAGIVPQPLNKQLRVRRNLVQTVYAIIVPLTGRIDAWIAPVVVVSRAVMLWFCSDKNFTEECRSDCCQRHRQ